MVQCDLSPSSWDSLREIEMDMNATEVVRDRSSSSENSTAIDTLPFGLILKDSANSTLSVWTQRKIERGTKFGPLKGTVVDTNSTWKLHNAKRSDLWPVFAPGWPPRIMHYVDTSNLFGSNWMRYVAFPGASTPHNLVACQVDGSIFFYAIDDIPAHKELKVWFHPSFFDRIKSSSAVHNLDTLWSSDLRSSLTRFKAHLTGMNPCRNFLENPIYPIPPQLVKDSPMNRYEFFLRSPFDCSFVKPSPSSHGGIISTPFFNSPRLQPQPQHGHSPLAFHDIPFQCPSSSSSSSSSCVKESIMAALHARRHVDFPPVGNDRSAGEFSKKLNFSERGSFADESLSSSKNEAVETQLPLSIKFECSPTTKKRNSLSCADPDSTETLNSPGERSSSLHNETTKRRRRSNSNDDDDYNHHHHHHHQRHYNNLQSKQSGHRELSKKPRGVATLPYDLPRVNGKTIYECRLCKKVCAQLSNLKVHMYTHTGERPFACPQCPSRFTQKAHLHKHMSTHTGVKPFSCSICGKKSASSSNIKAHMKVHEHR